MNPAKSFYALGCLRRYSRITIYPSVIRQRGKGVNYLGLSQLVKPFLINKHWVIT